MIKSWGISHSFFAPNARKSESSYGQSGAAWNSSVTLLDRSMAGNAASAAAHSVNRNAVFYYAGAEPANFPSGNKCSLRLAFIPDLYRRLFIGGSHVAETPWVSAWQWECETKPACWNVSG